MIILIAAKSIFTPARNKIYFIFDDMSDEYDS